jgi:alanine dehydrogenase
MDFGVLRETEASERRVGLTPDGVRALATAGHEVWVETGAGTASGFDDNEYQAAGAQLAWSPEELTARASTVLKVRALRENEANLIQPDQLYCGFLHLAFGNHTVLERLLESRASTLAYELVEEGGRFALLEPMSAMGARVAVTLLQYHLSSAGGGSGLLLGGCPGVPPMRVLVIGGGTAGRAAAREASRVGAWVTVLDIDPLQLREVARELPNVATGIASPTELARQVADADAVIGAVARRGEPAPKVLDRALVRSMRPGSTVVDLSIDEGGCVETSVPTTPERPVSVIEGIRHIAIPNLPSVVAHTASRAIELATLPYLLRLGELGLRQALLDVPALFKAAQVYRGELASRRVARHHGMTRRPLKELL